MIDGRDDDRRDACAVLSRVEKEGTRAARGRVRIFFGAAPGVGKTDAMLAEAQRLRQSGCDVVVGIVETHGRSDTMRLAEGLDVLPRTRVEYEGRIRDEFDLDRALARRPTVLLVDEFAHANAVGSRHRKRWQDVAELLDAGIDVYTTLDVQHLDSVNGIVAGITGVKLRETLPDRLFDESDEVVLVDRTPDDLLQRFKEGKVCFPEQSQSAVEKFFRKGNLLALRELALRRTADRADTQLRTYRIEHVAGAPAPKTRDARADAAAPRTSHGHAPRGGPDIRGYAGAIALCMVATVGAFPLHGFFALSNIVMLFLLAVVGVAVLFGRGPAVLAAFANVLAFDFFFVPPRFTLAIADAQDLFTFVVMLIVGLVVGQLTARLRYQARVASLGEERARRLFAMARDLSAALAREQVTEVGERNVIAMMPGDAHVLTLAADETLRVPGTDDNRADADMAIARWVVDHSEPAGAGTDTLPAAGRLYLPLKAPVRTRGVLVVAPTDPDTLMVPEQRRLLDTCAALIAIAIERVHFVTVAQDTLVEMESERLRNSVLSALSHDLRTPLTSLVGLADRLSHELASDPAGPQAAAIRDQARRTAELVDQLLEMAQLETRRTELRKDWQSIEELAGAALAELDAQLGGRDIDIALDPELPLVQCDGVLVTRVLVNLLGNAAKYTPPRSEIRIAAQLANGVVEIAVEDRGPGLPYGKERSIFEKFIRGRQESAIPGVGLGLAICRAIVAAHGGSIHAENRDGGGARFVFTLPAQSPPPPVEPENATDDVTSARDR